MIYMASTKIEPQKTISEIMSLLAKHKIIHIVTFYDGNGEITGLTFTIEYAGQNLPFKLPVRDEAVLKAMREDRETPNHLCNPKQAKRVAWRSLYRLLQGQLAFVKMGQADIKEIFMPYLMVSQEQTLYELMEKQKFLQLKE